MNPSATEKVLLFIKACNNYQRVTKWNKYVRWVLIQKHGSDGFLCFNKWCLNMFEQFAVVRQIKRLPLGRKLTGP